MCPVARPSLPSVSPTTACAILVPSSNSWVGFSSQLSILMVVSIVPVKVSVMPSTLYVTQSHVTTPSGGRDRLLSPLWALWRTGPVCQVGGARRAPLVAWPGPTLRGRRSGSHSEGAVTDGIHSLAHCSRPRDLGHRHLDPRPGPDGHRPDRRRPARRPGRRQHLHL